MQDKHKRLLRSVFYAQHAGYERSVHDHLVEGELEALLSIGMHASRIMISDDAGHLMGWVALRLEWLSSVSERYLSALDAFNGRPVDVTDRAEFELPEEGSGADDPDPNRGL